MRKIAALLLSLLALAGQAVAAQAWPDVDPGQAISYREVQGERFIEAQQHAARQRANVSYGPFRVIDGTRAQLSGVTDGRTPAAFEAMLRDFPGITTLEMITCPGTEDDQANLRLGRIIRAHGIATYVPEDGFVASGAVELFLAGIRRYAEPGAEFAVHSWQDERGREPTDYSIDAPQNRAYINYYRTMGMSEEEAKAFYAMTNSAPFAGAKWMTAGEMARWVSFDTLARPRAAEFAYFGGRANFARPYGGR